MWMYLLGPFLALLPWHWRRALPFHEAVPWKTAAILSGLAESVIAFGALAYWYSYSVTTWVSRALDNALNGKTSPGLSDHDIGFAALLIWSTHPLTWAICCVGIEGAVRLCAPFADTVLGIFPLYLIDKIHSKIIGRIEPEAAVAPKFAESNFSSYVGSVREKVRAGRHAPVPDELCATASGGEEVLEIRAWRAKPDWDPPRVVRYRDCYYRLEKSVRGAAPRPYVYKLRRLAAGVPRRTLLVYVPDEEPVIASR
ncbi:MAG TPA: hypothetical protein VE077_15735 [Candidatus Methylomirabilis sp.]|nr:hypothetical protein [Candidatus Methylomirabilis sp.]